MSGPRAPFRWVSPGDGTRRRHLRDGCRQTEAGTVAVMGHEAAWPACQQCRDVVVDALVAEGMTAAAGGPIRCEACAGWVRPGQVCRTCGNVAR